MSAASEDMLATVSLLWPPPARVELVGRGYADAGVRRELLMVPNARQPRLLLPGGAPRAAAAVALRSGKSGSLLSLGTRWILAAALVTGVADRLLPDRLVVRGDRVPQGIDGDGGIRDGGSQDVEEYLRGLLGRGVVVSVRSGAARANAKPLLHVLNRSGHTIAFVKIGHTRLTRSLVRDEAYALARIASARLTQVRAPEVLHRGTWRGLEILVIGGLPIGHGMSRRASSAPFAAMAEVASYHGSRACVGEGEHWSSLRSTRDLLRDECVQSGLSAILDFVEHRWGGMPIDVGAWHGDWAPWNMSRHGGRVSLWDWERYSEGVPVGFDALHHRLQVLRFGHKLSWESMVMDLLDDAPKIVAWFDVPRQAAQAVTFLYLAELCARYLHDAQTPSGEVLRPEAEELLRVLLRHVADDSRRTAQESS